MARHPGGRTCNDIVTAPFVLLVILAAFLANLFTNDPPPTGAPDPDQPDPDPADEHGPAPLRKGWPTDQRAIDLAEGRPERHLR